jgi:hypothetical protein
MLVRMRSNTRILEVGYVFVTYIWEFSTINRIIKSVVRENVSMCLLGSQMICLIRKRTIRRVSILGEYKLAGRQWCTRYVHNLCLIRH